MNFPVHFSSQLREHLRALRKARGLTQAALGQMLGVGQARIAEIENNPGVVSVDQLMKLLSALSVSMVLRDNNNADDDIRSGPVPGAAKSSASQAPGVAKKQPTPRAGVEATAGDLWPVQPVTGAGRRAPKFSLAARRGAEAASDARALPGTTPQADVASTPRRNVIIHPKKGSW